jgi:hypothetical protein
MLPKLAGPAKCRKGGLVPLMQEECTSPSYWSEVIGERWSCLGESVYYLIPIRVCFNRRSLTVAPTCHLAMSPDGGRAIRREDRGGGVISPISSPSLVDPDSVGVSTPHPPCSFTARWAALRACFLSFYVRIFLLGACFASHLATSSNRLASRGSLRSPLRPYARS